MILEAVHAAEESGGDTNKAANDCLPELDSRLHLRTLRDLIADGQLVGFPHDGGEDLVMVIVDGLGVAGRRSIGQWPNGANADALVQAIERAAAQESDPERRSRLERLREAATGVGRDVLTSVVTAVVRAHLGVPPS